jgi:hypothetical protein
MSDALLKSLFEADAPPARDVAFTLAVMERVERRRFWTEAAMLVPAVIAACVVLWALAPALNEMAVSWLGPFGQSAFVPVIALVTTLAALAFVGRDQARA